VLVALLVAAPVAAMLVGGVLVRTEHIGPLERWRSVNGQADVVVQSGIRSASAMSAGPALRSLLAHHAVRMETDLSSQVLRTVGGHRSELTFAIVPMDDPLTRGMFVMTAGRAPVAPDDVFLTRTAARDLNVRVGEELRLAAPTRDTFRVTGIGEEAGQFGESEMVLPPRSVWRTRLPNALVSWLVAAPGVPTATLERLANESLQSTSTEWTLQLSPQLVPVDNRFIAADAETKVRWSWVLGAVALTVTGIVIAAAFAVGARRQLATLGILSGSGASPRFLYLLLVLQGMWTGLVGAVLGVGLGAGVLALLRPHLDEILGHVVGGYVFRATDLVPIVVLGIVAATVAAAVPAHTATRAPVLAALAGRRPLGRVPAWLPVTGAATVGVGLVVFSRAMDNSNGGTNKANSVLLGAIVGCVLTLLGGCAIAPAFVSLLERAGSRTFGAARIATRSLARQRTRTAAVVSAVAATSALAIGGSALVLGQHAAHARKARTIAPDEVVVSGPFQPDGSSPPSDALVAAVARVLPQAERIPIRVAITKLTWAVSSVRPVDDFEWGSYQAIGVGQLPGVTIADPATISLDRLSESEQRAFARSGWLVFGHSKGEIDFTLGTLGTRGPSTPIITMGRKIETVHAVLLPGLDHDTNPGVLITPAKAAQLHLQARPGPIVFRSPTELTKSQRTAIADLPASLSFVDMYRPPARVSPILGEWALVGIALALVLFVVAVNLGLSAAETRDERDILAVVGAAPGEMARTSGYKAAILTVMGALMAIPIGFLPVALFVHAAPGVIPLEFPWRVVMLLVIAVPLVGGVTVTAGSAAALRFRPVRISTMAYD
jgi:putative ABC transport system permease protein